MDNKLEDLTRRYKKKSSALLFFSGGLDTSFLCHFFSKNIITKEKFLDRYDIQ